MSQVYDRFKLVEGLPWFVAYSGGKDSSVLLDLVYRYAEKHGVNFTVLHNEELLKPPPHMAWVYGVLGNVAKRDVSVVVTIPREDYLTMVLERRYSPPGVAFLWCTARLKERPTARLARLLLSGKYALFTGVRIAESPLRGVRITERSVGELFIQKVNDGAIHIAPIVDWSDEDVVAYIKTHRQPWSGEDYSYLIEKVYCGRFGVKMCTFSYFNEKVFCGTNPMRTGCTLCTVVTRDYMLQTYAECHADPRYLKVLEVKRMLREIGLDWDMRLYKSKKLNDVGLKAVRELLTELFDAFPELLAGYATFKPETVERLMPEVSHHLNRLKIKLPDNVTVLEL